MRPTISSTAYVAHSIALSDALANSDWVRIVRPHWPSLPAGNASPSLHSGSGVPPGRNDANHSSVRNRVASEVRMTTWDSGSAAQATSSKAATDARRRKGRDGIARDSARQSYAAHRWSLP